MMRHCTKSLYLLATLLFYSFTVSVYPQQQDVERVEIRRVRLPVTVLDKKGHPVTGLKPSDFIIFEDKKPQQIETFSDESGPGQPLYVGVLMDTSPSAISKLKFEQEAAMNFLRSVLRLRKDHAALVTFDDKVTLRQDFTDKIDLRYDGNFRRIEVKLVTSRDGLKLRAKRGYVASAQTGKGR